MEPVACELYYDKMKSQHKTFSVNTTGLLIGKDHPILGASPDGIVTCSGHGTGLLEIMCTYKFKNKIIQSIVDKHYSLTLTSTWGGGEGRVGKRFTRSTPAMTGARARDLPRARRESPAAYHGGCLDKQAFLYL